MSCDRFETLLHWRDTDQVDRVEAHLATCPACAEAWRALDELTALGQALPDGLPPARRVESVRTALLAQSTAAPEPRRAGWGWIALAAALVLAVGGWLLWPNPSALGRIDGTNATYAVERNGGAEHVWLSEGSLAINVAHLEPDQRFVVHTDDAEIEVRGTRFRVRAQAGRLQQVEVQSGRVEVRPRSGATVLLKASESWRSAPASAPASMAAAMPQVPQNQAPQSQAPESRSPISQAPQSQAPRSQAPHSQAARGRAPQRQAPERRAPVVRRGAGPSSRARPAAHTSRRAPRTVAPPSTPPQSVPSSAAASIARPQQSVHFERGWRALQASAYGEAIEGFNAAMMLKGPLAQDARWWHAVALGRAGREAAMRRALRRFIGRYPTAARAAEAQVMLGWSLFAAGQIEAAEKAFAQGSRAARPAARKSAAAGQRAIREWRAQRER